MSEIKGERGMRQKVSSLAAILGAVIGGGIILAAGSFSPMMLEVWP